MKNQLFVLLLFAVCFLIFSCRNTQHPVQSGDSKKINSDQVEKEKIIASTTFEVCKVEKATELLPAVDYQEVILKKTVTDRNKKEKMSAIYSDDKIDWSLKEKRIEDPDYQPEGVPVRILEDAAEKNIQLVATDFHPFMAAMHQAYASHYPMTISPDMIWLLIAQGFATHINQNSEKLRSQFVDFDGKKQIDVRRDDFIKGSKDNDWTATFATFSQKIEDNTGKGLLELVTGDFSTTGPVEKAAFQITLMDAMKSYFEYSLTTSCGIPSIILEGTVEDWQEIESKTQALAQYDLAVWVEALMPVLQEFTNAAKGKPDNDFWQSMYKWNEVGSGSPYITGWILKFFPYKEQGNKIVEFAVQKAPAGQHRATHNLVAETSEFPSGLAQADFIWNYFETFYQMEFVGGFVGFQQNAETLSLRPEISWAVIDKQMKATPEQIETYRKGGDKNYLDDKNGKNQ